MQRYKMIVAYEGTNYNGWQVQKDKPSIAHTLQSTFYTVFNAKTTCIGVSRTDTGVHAMGQVVTFKTERALNPKKMMFAWNNRLPEGISIQHLECVDSDYNPFLNITSKTYWYHFFLDQPSPFVGRYGWHINKHVELPKLEQALAVFVGTHDFRSFSSGDERGDDTIRTIDSIDLCHVPELNAYRIIVKGPKFLQHMIRRIVGAALDVASKEELSADYLRKVMEQKNPRQTLFTAPARGLVLHEICYKTLDEK